MDTSPSLRRSAIRRLWLKRRMRLSATAAFGMKFSLIVLLRSAGESVGSDLYLEAATAQICAQTRRRGQHAPPPRTPSWGDQGNLRHHAGDGGPCLRTGPLWPTADSPTNGRSTTAGGWGVQPGRTHTLSRQRCQQACSTTKACELSRGSAFYEGTCGSDRYPSRGLRTRSKASALTG